MSYTNHIRNLLFHRPIISILTIFFFGLVIFLLFFWQTVLTAMGNFLVEENQLTQSEYIIVLQGGIPDRIVHGTELYDKGYGDKILMAESHSFNNYELIEEHELELPTNVDINREAATQMGVKQEDITIVPGKVDSTREEAQKLSQYLSDRYNNSELENKSIILVTSRFHSQRAKYIFSEELNKIEVISSPSPYDPYSPNSWWTDRRQARNTFMEYIKFINTVTFDF